jgi:hypothetical protein
MALKRPNRCANLRTNPSAGSSATKGQRLGATLEKTAHPDHVVKHPAQTIAVAKEMIDVLVQANGGVAAG